MKNKILSILIVITILLLETPSLPVNAIDSSINATYNYNYDKILTGDFSDFAGVWENALGGEINLQVNGMDGNDSDDDFTFSVEDIRKEDDGSYTWAVVAYYNGRAVDGYAIILYPENVDIISWNGRVVNTDKSKMRMWVGNGSVTEQSDYIFYKVDTTLNEQYTNSEISVILDGNKIQFDQQPIIAGNRTLVPIRAIFEAMGYTVEWYEGTQTAIAAKGDNEIKVQLNNSIIDYRVNGVSGTYICDVLPQMLSNRIFVPVRAIAESAGCSVDWDESTQTVYITTTLIDITDVIYYDKNDVIKRFGEPIQEITYYSEVDSAYDYTELVYNDIVFDLGHYDGGEYINYFDIPNVYKFFGIHVGMSKSELLETLDNRLSLYTVYEYTSDPFDDNEVTYQIVDYYAFVRIGFDNEIISKIEYLSPND